MDRLSENFVRTEFRCRCGCGFADVSEDLVAVLQRMRTRKRRPLRIVSGARCRRHNATVGGSPRSQHLIGHAADVPGGFATASEWHRAGAVGVGVRDGRVVHVDVRHGRRPFVFND